MKRIFSLWTPVVVWAGLIFYLSSLRIKPPSGNLFFDLILPNLIHLGEYGVLFVLIFRASKNGKLSFLVGLFYAISDEFHQKFVPTRNSDLFDVLIDLSGMIIAWILLWKLLPRAPGKLKNWAKKWQIL